MILTEESKYIAKKYTIEELALLYEATRNDMLWHSVVGMDVRIQCHAFCGE